MEFSAQSDISRPPEEVFDRMADARNDPAWNSQVSSSELVSEGQVGPGGHRQAARHHRLVHDQAAG